MWFSKLSFKEAFKLKTNIDWKQKIYFEKTSVIINFYISCDLNAPNLFIKVMLLQHIIMKPAEDLRILALTSNFFIKSQTITKF